MVEFKANPYNTPLHVACAEGHLDVAKVLVMADVNCTDSTGRTPLHEACGEGHLEF